MFNKINKAIRNIENNDNVNENCISALNELKNIKDKINKCTNIDLDEPIKIKKNRTIDDIINNIEKNDDIDELRTLYIEGLKIIKKMENEKKEQNDKIKMAIEENDRIKLSNIKIDDIMKVS